MSRHTLKHPWEAGARRLNVGDSIHRHGRRIITIIMVFSHSVVSESGRLSAL